MLLHFNRIYTRKQLPIAVNGRNKFVQFAQNLKAYLTAILTKQRKTYSVLFRGKIQESLCHRYSVLWAVNKPISILYLCNSTLRLVENKEIVFDSK